MIRHFKIVLLVMGFCSLSFTSKFNDACTLKNNAFKADEEVRMKVFYSTLGMYVGAGEAVFTSSLERYNGKPVYHFVGTGTTYSFFDNFLKYGIDTKAMWIQQPCCLINLYEM